MKCDELFDEQEPLFSEGHDLAGAEEAEADVVEPAEVEEEEVRAAVVEHFDDAIKLYLREIQKTKLLTAD